ncbi:mitogen-activated protein kinase [Thecamonas trahens ATCC 50062]|uniref:Mitogen-activated protein kinase n=1 Tax=Thecamonas trahens ATCC 50062 TaxID=461836 RepID=A0A0L0DGN7_THETB|nr:mitogen-activated protein kinase [Thecamonas trahens ATCC 50062]KNC51504.1 mitogen-activated protein kinase [Thecamonas trahens ATCC 50062]|eukprot:XP_013755907.1 mitogen-activated protein kinase [Thecamonas trahens ATCC 50062]
MKFLVSRSLEELNLVFSGLSSQGILGRIENYSCKPSGRDKRMEKNLDARIRSEIASSPEMTSLTASAASGSSSSVGQLLPPIASASTASGAAVPSQADLERLAAEAAAGTSVASSSSQLSVGSPSTLSRSPTTPYTEAFRYDISDSPFGSLIEPANRMTMIHLIEVLNMSFTDYDFSGLRANSFERLRLAEALSRLDATLAPLFPSYHMTLKPRLWKTMEQEIEPSACDVYAYLPDEAYSSLFVDALWSANLFSTTPSSAASCSSSSWPRPPSSPTRTTSSPCSISTASSLWAATACPT